MQAIDPVTTDQLLAAGQIPLMKFEIYVDADGINWTIRSSAADNSWFSVTYGNGLFVAVSDTGLGTRVMTSPDGINWTIRSSAANRAWQSVTYGNGMFVAVARTGTGDRVMTSPNGIDWTIRSSAKDNDWRSVVYGNGLFVAVATSGSSNRAMTSPNGIDWTIRSTPWNNPWQSVTYGNGLFVAVAYYGTGNRVMTSPNGIDWTIRSSAADNHWNSVTYGSGLFVAVAQSGTGNRVMTSPNGIDWTIRSSAADNNWFEVGYGNKVFVAVAYSGTSNRVMTSPNGIDWTIRSSAADNSWRSVTYGGGMFVAVSNNGTGNRVMTSSGVTVNLGDLDGKNYVEGISISLGGASKTPNPVAGSWNAILSNENSIFHPQHPTSAYKDWLKSGRKTKISVGARYGGVDRYWQRIIGFMNIPKFSAPDYKVAINGGDYMKLLQEMELRSPDNYWGTSETFDSIASDGFIGDEIYAEADAMEIGEGEDDNVDNWTPTNCAFVSEADEDGGSTYVGKMTISSPADFADVKNTDVGNVVEGKKYRVAFKYKRDSGSSISVLAYQSIGGADVLCGAKYVLSTDSYTEASFIFTARKTGPVEIWIVYNSLTDGQFRLDQFSVREYKPYWERYYELPEASKGPYYVTLDGDPVWQGEEDEGWFHEESTRRVFFDINKVVAKGTANLVIYYFTVQSPENVVADLLVKAGLYADRAAALLAMEYTATEVTIDKVWFKPGSPCLNAIKKLCERCDYRFHLKYDGTPVFKPKPAPEETSFTFTDPKQIAAFSTYQDRSEIKNRIVIEGMKQAEPVGKEETMPPELQGEAHDDDSIAAYGERTLTIKNHLFQTQDAINAMKAKLLAEYKNPKWYTDLEVPFNPVPLEIGDKNQWEERLSPVLDITKTGVIRDMKIDNFNTTYVCEL